MASKRTKKWIPVLLVLLFATGAIIALFFLPETQQGPAPQLALTMAASGASSASGAPEVLLPLDAETLEEDEDLAQPPPTIDEEEHEYPTPFAKPDAPSKE